MKRDKRAIFKVTHNSEIIYAVQKKGWFYTYLQFYDITDIIDGKKRPVIYYRLIKNCNMYIKLCEAMEHKTENLLAVTIKFRNKHIEELVNEIKHAYKYVELNYPDSTLVHCVNEEKDRQNLLKHLYSGERFGECSEQ